MIQRLNGSQDSSHASSPGPYHRPNDRFVSIPGIDGSAAGYKKPSLRQRRRNFTAATTAFTMGVLLIVCSSDWSKEFLVPGPLSSHHAPLIASESGDRCATCHANANGSLASWIAGVFASTATTGISQSDLCMKCHEQSLNSQFALNPHNIDPVELKALTSPTPTKKLDLSKLLPSPVDHTNQIACRVCHQEHHGGTNLTTLTDAQCQTCHGNSFHSFESGHPEFANYPQQRRTRIAFDHSSHAGKHFIEKQTEFDCNRCHVDDPFQNVKRLASFEHACAECHNTQILASGTQGLALIALPMLDMRAIEAAELTVGSWPLAATGDFDGEIPPMMRLMLAADPAAQDVLQSRRSDFEFFDFDASNQADVSDAVTLAWAIKRLLNDLATNGPQAVRQRLEHGLGFEISDEQLRGIITNLDGPVFQNAARSWLPQLSAEITASEFPGRRPSVPPEEPPSVATPANVWDDPRSGDASNGLPNFEKPSNVLGHPLKSIAQQNIDWKPSDSDIVMSRAGSIADDPLLLAENPLSKLMNRDQPVLNGPVNESPQRKPLEPPTELNESQVKPDSAESENGAVLPTPQKTLPAKKSTPETIGSGSNEVPSGWYRNDQTFRISYKPSGHADDCLSSWIELVTRATDANRRPETKQLFERTISLTGIGLCRTCHTLDQLPDRSFLVNWVAEYRDPSIRSFTRFAHGPHLLQPELQDCSGCHQLDTRLTNAASFLSVDSSEIVSNFLPTTKNDCVQCHQQSRSRSGCTQCHNYHVGSHVIGSK